MIKYIVIFLFIFCCNSSNTNSFIELKKAYYKWHNKNNNFIKSNYNKNKLSYLDYKIIEEYIYDLKRFDLELSQISKAQLKNNYQIDYDIILNNINVSLFDYQSIDRSKYSINEYLNKIYRILMSIINDVNLLAFEKITLIKKQAIYINNSFDFIKERDIQIKESQLSLFNKQINALIVLLENLPNLLNLDIHNYKELEGLLRKIKANLNKYKFVINYETEIFNKSIIDNNYHSKYKFYLNNIFANSAFDKDAIYKFIDTNIYNLQIQIFDECLKIYMLNNDEPIWIDKQDTLDVINYVLNNNFRLNTIDKDDLIDEINNQYNNISEDFELLELNKDLINHKINFVEKKEYHLNNSLLDVFTNNCIVDTDNAIYYNKYIISDYLFESLISNNIYNIIYLNNNDIRRINNKTYNQSLSKFLNYILVNNLYKNDSKYKIHFYLNLLKSNLKILNQDNYINSKSSKEDIIVDFIQNGYMDKIESRKLFEELESMDNIYILEYLIYLHFVNLYDKYCIIDNKYSPAQLFDKIINNGTIPFYYNN